MKFRGNNRITLSQETLKEIITEGLPQLVNASTDGDFLTITKVSLYENIDTKTIEAIVEFTTEDE